VHHTGIAGSGFKSLEEGKKVTYEVSQDRKDLQAANVSKGSLGPDPERTKEYLKVPLEVEGAARTLAEHFDPDDLYWAMVDSHRGQSFRLYLGNRSMENGRFRYTARVLIKATELLLIGFLRSSP
jgi:hypothetical protein